MPAKYRALMAAAFLVVGAVLALTFLRPDPLAVAASEGDRAEVERLLDNGHDVNSSDLKGRTALMAAVLKDDAVLTRLLVERGAEVDTLADGMTPLCVAAAGGFTEIARALLAAGADVDRPANRNTPLMYATFGGFPDLVKLLLDAGAQVNRTREGTGETALMLAAVQGKSDILKTLLAQGADPTIKNSRGHTAQDLAKKKGHNEATKLLSSSPQ